MEDWNWFMYGNVGEYYTIRKKLNKKDKELFDFMTEHFTERYSKLTDDAEKDKFIDMVDDIFTDFAFGQDFWEDSETLPWWKE